jgi:HK97 family phage major capsid protein
MDANVSIPVEKLDELSDALVIQKQINEDLAALKAGQISEEEFDGKVTELVKLQLEENSKAIKEEAERKISFAEGQITSDPCRLGIQKALKAGEPGMKQALFAEAMTMKTDDAELKALQDLNDDLLIADMIMKSGVGKYRYDAAGGMKSLKLYGRYMQAIEQTVGKDAAVAPMDTTDTAYFVPTGMSAQVLELPVLYGAVEGLFQHLPCPTKTYTVPIDLSGGLIADLIAEATTGNTNPGDTLGHTITDGQTSFTAAKLRARLITSAELDEDSIVTWLPFMKQKLAQTLGNTVEAAILNGDTTATHQDADIETLGATDGRCAWKGLRKLAIAGSLNSSLASGNVNDANMLVVKALLGKYGTDPKEGAWIFGPHAYVKYVLKLTNVVTQNLYGPKATVTTGELVQYMGSPVIVSEHCREFINASGVEDGTTATKGTMLYVNHRNFFVGDRRMVTIDAEKWLTTDQINMVAFRRLDFQPIQAPSSTYSIVGIGYNFTS